MNTVQKLASLFAELPGIGPRQAKRFVYFLLNKNQAYLDELSNAISQVRNGVVLCPECFRFFSKQNNILCEVCSDKNRNQSVLMIVGRDVDIEQMEKTDSFDGFYFVLGGAVPILESAPEKRIRVKELLESIEKRAVKGLKEVILAMSAHPEGEHTSDYVKRVLEPAAQKYGFSISTLGRGLSTGTELEYSDSETLKNALENRK